MKTVTKRNFICVKPVSDIAKIRFETEMNNLHSCYVDSEKNETMFLTSVNGKYKFTMDVKEDSNWQIIK
jgi:hypothetical protein